MKNHGIETFAARDEPLEPLFGLGLREAIAAAWAARGEAKREWRLDRMAKKLHEGVAIRSKMELDAGLGSIGFKQQPWGFDVVTNHTQSDSLKRSWQLMGIGGMNGTILEESV